MFVETTNFNRFFEPYKVASCQNSNLKKSTLCSSPSKQEEIIVICPEYYLGLPTNARTDKQKMFRDIKILCVEHKAGNHVDVCGR